MNKCIDCGKDTILSVSGKTSDLCDVRLNDKTISGYVPRGLGIGGGDYLEFKLCISCGKIQDKFPKSTEVFQEEEDYA